MRLYIPAEALPAAGVSSDDVANWLRRGGLNFHIADERPGKARRYSRANVYEFALLNTLLAAGLTLNEAKVQLRQRLAFLVAQRAQELDCTIPELSILEKDENWFVGDLSHRDRTSPIAWLIYRDGRHGDARLVGCKLRNVPEVIKFHRNEGGTTTAFHLADITELLARVDAALAGEDLPAGPSASIADEY